MNDPIVWAITFFFTAVMLWMLVRMIRSVLFGPTSHRIQALVAFGVIGLLFFLATTTMKRRSVQALQGPQRSAPVSQP